MALVYLGLGTNIGNKKKNLKKAIDNLNANNKINTIKKSTVLKTDPVDYFDQPQFLNQIVLLETQLTPEALLAFIKECENKMGRKKTIHKGPRVIDMDILLYDNLIINTESLTIPHPEIMNRPFILYHLVELNQELTDPQTNKKYSEAVY